MFSFTSIFADDANYNFLEILSHRKIFRWYRNAIPRRILNTDRRSEDQESLSQIRYRNVTNLLEIASPRSQTESMREIGGSSIHGVERGLDLEAADWNSIVGSSGYIELECLDGPSDNPCTFERALSHRLSLHSRSFLSFDSSHSSPLFAPPKSPTVYRIPVALFQYCAMLFCILLLSPLLLTHKAWPYIHEFEYILHAILENAWKCTARMCLCN